ncbi:MAG: PAS domain-containing protein [Rhodomicrobium sp.]
MSALGAPLRHHFDLYRYWQAKRGERRMPARGDLDPINFAAQWPYLMLVERIEVQYRYRLIGSALTKQLGRDVTGAVVGSQFSNASEAIAAKRVIYDRVFANACPVLASVELGSSFGNIHNVLQLLLPLSDNGAEVNMVISTLIARFGVDSQGGSDLKRLAVTVRDVVEVDAASGLERLCLEWEQHCLHPILA